MLDISRYNSISLHGIYAKVILYPIQQIKHQQ